MNINSDSSNIIIAIINISSDSSKIIIAIMNICSEIVLTCAVLCYAVWCSTDLCYAMLCGVVLTCAMLCCVSHRHSELRNRRS